MGDDETRSATAEEIREWNAENDEPHPVFEVEHRPERKPLETTGRPLFDARDEATFDAALETWGIDAQADMAEEEAAEFLVASKHYARGKIGPDELIDELADVRIMYEQLARFMGHARVERRVRQKMDRLRERLPEDVEVDS